MGFQGPTADVFNNVRMLNVACLQLLHVQSQNRDLGSTAPTLATTTGAEVRDRRLGERHTAARLAGRLGALDRLRRERHADAPFLLMSFCEHDEAVWASVLDGVSHPDLFTNATDAEYAQLMAASLGFLWQLSRQNPYAARVISGAGLEWCERLADCTLIDLLGKAGHRIDLIGLRAASNARFWNKLLGAGISAQATVRRAAHLCALQTLLTRRPSREFMPRSAAACELRVPAARLRSD